MKCIYAIDKRGLGVVLGLACVLFDSGQARATAELRQQVGKLAREIKKYLDEAGEKEVAVGQFVGPPQLAANPGPGLVTLLTRELRDLNVIVKMRNANLYVAGEFRDVTDKESRQLAVELKAKVMDRRNKLLGEASFGILGPESIGLLLGSNTSLPPRPGPDPARQIERALDNPKVHIDGTRLASGPGRPYGMEIVVGGTPRPLELIEGLPFIDIRREEIYAVSLYNDSDRDVAVKLCIDGIDIFAFNEDPEPDGKQRDYHVVVPKKNSALVKGWYRRSGTSDSFMVTEYSKSAAARLAVGNLGQLGVITASFRACWLNDSDRPTDEPQTRSGDLTGFGPPVQERYERVLRTIGQPRDILTVRYQRK